MSEKKLIFITVLLAFLLVALVGEKVEQQLSQFRQERFGP